MENSNEKNVAGERNSGLLVIRVIVVAMVLAGVLAGLALAFGG